MAISSAICSSFKQELLQGKHSLDTSGNGGDTFKLAMYTSSASLGATTTAYSTSQEISGTGYSAGGATLTNTGVGLNSTTAFTDFSDVSFTSSSFTANGCLIYNTNNSNKAVCAIDFGGDKTSTAGDFTIVFPSATATGAIIRLA